MQERSSSGDRGAVRVLVFDDDRDVRAVILSALERSGALVYQGRISGLRIEHTGSLAAGSAARFTVQTTWPSTNTDAAYEGAGMGFTVVASPFPG